MIVIPPKVIWLYGLSGAGKTTLAKELSARLRANNIPVKHLDGDLLRKGLNNNLGYSLHDRHENIRRSAEVAKLFFESGFVTICSFITPTNELRELVRFTISKNYLIEVYVEATLQTCRSRDPKGLYKKVAKGELKNFTGIDSAFECPASADIVINTDKMDVKMASDKLLKEITGYK